MARNALATTARAVKAAAGQWLVLFFLTFVLACPAISMAAAAAATPNIFLNIDIVFMIICFQL